MLKDDRTLSVIVDDQPATRTFISEYWNQLSLYSLPTAYRDPGCN